MSFELTACELVIENEIRRGASQMEVAETYRLARLSTWPTDWRRVNQAILARWGDGGLQRVKEMAAEGLTQAEMFPPRLPGWEEAQG